METVDRMHHICLTVSSENWKVTWPKQMAFFTDFLKMNAYYVPVEEFDFEISLQGVEEGMGMGPQKIQSWYEDGTPRIDYFYYVAGEDMSEFACMIDLIVFVTDPGQLTEPQPNMHTLGLRGLTLLVDNLDAVYARGQEMGQVFLSEPVTLDWGALGQVKHVIVKDAVGNPIELVQTDEGNPNGDGKVLRIFSNNQNTQDIDKALTFYRDGCGMSVAAEVELSGPDFEKSHGAPAGAKATTYFLKGTNPEAKTFFTLTDWENPGVEPHQLADKRTPSFFRQWFWVNGDSGNVKNLFKKMQPQMKAIGAEPYTYPSCRPWSECTMSFFQDNDGVLQEFANHKEGEGEWKGLEEMVDHPEHGHNFDKGYDWSVQVNK